jgi:hypothetical protein
MPVATLPLADIALLGATTRKPSKAIEIIRFFSLVVSIIHSR